MCSDSAATLVSEKCGKMLVANGGLANEERCGKKNMTANTADASDNSSNTVAQNSYSHRPAASHSEGYRSEGKGVNSYVQLGLSMVSVDMLRISSRTVDSEPGNDLNPVNMLDIVSHVVDPKPGNDVVNEYSGSLNSGKLNKYMQYREQMSYTCKTTDADAGADSFTEISCARKTADAAAGVDHIAVNGSGEINLGGPCAPTLHTAVNRSGGLCAARQLGDNLLLQLRPLLPLHGKLLCRLRQR